MGLVGDEVAYAMLGPEQAAVVEPDNLEECLARWRRGLPGRPAGGCLVRHLWELVDLNGDEITLDTWLSGPERPRRDDVPLALVGPADRLVIDPSARIDPLVAADTTGAQTLHHQEQMMGEIAKLLAPNNGKLDPKDYDRTVSELLSGGSDPVITKKPEGAWSHAVYDAMK